MNKFILAALLAAQTASAEVVYDAVDDPRCHDDPSRPVLEPTPGPTPYPDPPTNDRIVTYVPPATTQGPPEVPCTGEVTGFQIVDLDTGDVTDLADQQTIALSSMPDTFTIKAVTTSDSLSAVELFLNDVLYNTDDAAPYTFTVDNWDELNTEGTFTISAKGPTDTEGLKCSIQVSTTFGNPHDCEGIIQQFALFDTITQEIVPGYPLLHNNEVIQKSGLANPDHLTIIAIDNGRRGGDVIFGYDNDYSYSTSSHAVPSISGRNANGDAKTWEVLNQNEFIRIRAKSSDMMGIAESRVCEIALQIEQNWSCPYRISGFALVYAGTHTAVPGYENILGYKAVDLNDIDAPNGLSIKAHSSHSGVIFYVNGNYERTENWAPYALNGDNGNGLHEYTDFQDVGQYVIEVVQWHEWSQSLDKACSLTLTIQRDATITTIDDPTYCAPEAVVPEQVGNVVFESTPVAVQSRVVNTTVSFKTNQTIASHAMDWVTTVFVTETGYEVCDKIDNMAYLDASTNTYEAKCFNGFAYADIYAYSSSFDASAATADITMLPDGCKSTGADKVVKYTIVFSCDCDAIPDIPDDFIGGPNKKSDTCTGVTGYSWGDPHVVPFNGRRWDHGWNCQGEGEFVLSKATLTGYPYDFELRSRFTMFGQNLPWTFNSGMVAKQDVSVQISMGVIGETAAKPNMMDNVPVYFYVDGVPRLFSEGTGDLRVKVRVDGFRVYLTFVETGIQVSVRVRPFQSDHHSGIMNSHSGQEIPGSMETYLCLPSENDSITNVMGLLGTPTADMTDNFMRNDGTQISKPSNTQGLKQYCEDEWCITDSASTFFSFEPNKDFSTYNKCGSSGRRELTANPDDLPQEVLDECDKVDRNQFCLEEGELNGLTGAREAVRSMLEGEWAQRSSDGGKQPDDARCCSTDYKTCNMDSCSGKHDHACKACDASAVLLPGGELPLQGCVGLDGDVGSSSCCPGLELNTDGKCVVADRRRKLEEFKFERPGVEENARNIVPLHTEL